MITLTLKPAATRRDTSGGFVLYGRTPGIVRKFRRYRETDWLEKWFRDEAAALRYAARLGADVQR